MQELSPGAPVCSLTTQAVAVDIGLVVTYQAVVVQSIALLPARRMSRDIKETTARISSFRRTALMFWALAW